MQFSTLASGDARPSALAFTMLTVAFGVIALPLAVLTRTPDQRTPGAVDAGAGALCRVRQPPRSFPRRSRRLDGGAGRPPRRAAAGLRHPLPGVSLRAGRPVPEARPHAAGRRGRGRHLLRGRSRRCRRAPRRRPCCWPAGCSPRSSTRRCGRASRTSWTRRCWAARTTPSCAPTSPARCRRCDTVDGVLERTAAVGGHGPECAPRLVGGRRRADDARRPRHHRDRGADHGGAPAPAARRRPRRRPAPALGRPRVPRRRRARGGAAHRRRAPDARAHRPAAAGRGDGAAGHRGRAAGAPLADQPALPVQCAHDHRLPHRVGAAPRAQDAAAADVAAAQRAPLGRRDDHARPRAGAGGALPGHRTRALRGTLARAHRRPARAARAGHALPHRAAARGERRQARHRQRRPAAARCASWPVSRPRAGDRRWSWRC